VATLKQINLLIFFLLITIITFPFGYDELLRDAQELAWNGQYEKAEEMFSRLIEDFNTEELIIAYSNTLAWQGKYDEAIKIIENSKIESDVIEEQKAKIYFWSKEFEKALKIIDDLKSKNYIFSDEINNLVEDYYNFKFNKIFVDYKTELMDTEITSLFSGGYTYNNRDIYGAGVSGEITLLNYSLNKYSLQFDFSKDFYNIFAGLSDNQFYFLGGKIYLNNFNFGYRNSLYKGNEDINLKYSLLNQGTIGYSIFLDDGYLNLNVNLINTLEFYDFNTENIFNYYVNPRFNLYNFDINYFFNHTNTNNLNASYDLVYDMFSVKFVGDYDFISDLLLIGMGFEFIY
jgi:hypothetical protein